MTQLNYKQKYLDFLKLTVDEKKEVVIEMLEILKGRDETTDMIYEYILSGSDVTEKDLADVYGAILFGMKQDDNQTFESSIRHLDEIKDDLMNRRELEIKEKNDEIAQAEALITII